MFAEQPIKKDQKFAFKPTLKAQSERAKTSRCSDLLQTNLESRVEDASCSTTTPNGLTNRIQTRLCRLLSATTARQEQDHCPSVVRESIQTRLVRRGEWRLGNGAPI